MVWAVFSLGLLWWAGAARAQGGVELSIERCEGLPFDVEAYAHAVEVELIVLNAAALVPAPEGGGGPKLTVRSPSCDDALTVTLRVGEREASEALRASDFAGVGQPRALALATIEALRVLSLRLQALASEPKPVVAPEPDPAAPANGGPVDAARAEATSAEPKPTAEPKLAETKLVQPKPVQPKPAKPKSPAPKEPVEPKGPPAPRPNVTKEGYARAGAGLFGAHDLHLQAGFAFALVRPLVWLDAGLSFGHSSDTTDLGGLGASELALSATAELRLWLAGPLAFAAGAGVRGGFAWASLDAEPPLAANRSAQTALGPVLSAVVPLVLSLDLGAGAVVGLFVEPGYALVGARFKGPTATDVGMSELTGEAPPRVELLGASLYGGLILGYRF